MEISIAIGSEWMHKNGCGPYKVILIANLWSHNTEYPPAVVYKGKNGRIWCKHVNNFLCTMIPVQDWNKAT